jgi:hypothetical protein
LARDSAQRRLATILSNEDYGPKLARLRGEDERHVLSLIEQNRGKEARLAILEADEKRRERQRELRSQRESRKRPIIRTSVKTRAQREREAVRRILSVFGGKANTSRVSRNVSLMTNGELDFTADADRDSLTLRASGPADRTDASGKDLNPFWYH